MKWFEALILGIIQGLTEFLPVSSSGHLEIGKAFFGIETTEDMTFTIVVHGATVLSTIIIFRKDILQLFKALFAFKWNDDTKYILKLIISAIPIVIVGLFLEEQAKSLFDQSLILVGSMLIVTALLLSFTYFAKNKKKNLPFLDVIIIGIAQALAVLPGLSRSGATIATGIILGNNKEKTAKFSFLMVLIPIIGINIIDLAKLDFSAQNSSSILPLVIGFVAAFIAGLLACKLMLNIVKKSKLIYFAIYCFIVGLITIIFTLLMN